jgi:hypothetical protein
MGIDDQLVKRPAALASSVLIGFPTSDRVSSQRLDTGGARVAEHDNVVISLVEALELLRRPYRSS